MEKFKLFVENILIYGFGGIISKLIPIIMIPIVVSMMPNSAYVGISDLANTITYFAAPLAIMGMYDAMYRLFFEKEEIEYKKKVCSTTIVITALTSILIFGVMIISKTFISGFFFGDNKYANLVYICAATTLVTATNGIVSAPTRMQNKRKIFLVTNTLGPGLSYAIAIPLLLKGHYLVALPIAGLISGFVIEVSFWCLNHSWFKLSYFDKRLIIPLLSIAIPLVPNFIVYWIFNSSDKIMITHLLSVSDAGIYAIGSKLGLASQLIYTAFAGGWQFFAFSTMKDDNQVEINSRVFEYLGIISFTATCYICAWCYGLYKLLFIDEYTESFIISPYLFLAPLLQMLFQTACNQFIVIKKTWPNIVILSIGAVVNIALNMLLIPSIGIEGASIATLLGYILSDIICCLVLVRMKLMLIKKRFLVSSGLMFVFFLVWRFTATKNILLGTLLAMLITGIYALLYRTEITTLIKKKF
ncbi:lipopolysaccharide biosynthesis protein [Butyrivibrio fibrisolvens]|uniref:lipopolysaccharide biosynthesis protein n=1 Tax=Butyrivibrio fibrisolvens TaxID=831 RepID=UPI00041E8AEF|nr:polysaccharide biosynthesis C-terminal domain-containing protein [Butyrivibrio fibrisolvens]